MAKARSVFLPMGCLLLTESFAGLSKHVPLEPFVPTVAPTASTFAFVRFKPSQVLATISVFSSFLSNCVGAGRFPTTRQPGGEANICTKAVPLYQADVFRRVVVLLKINRSRLQCPLVGNPIAIKITKHSSYFTRFSVCLSAAFRQIRIKR